MTFRIDQGKAEFHLAAPMPHLPFTSQDREEFLRDVLGLVKVPRKLRQHIQAGSQFLKVLQAQ